MAEKALLRALSKAEGERQKLVALLARFGSPLLRAADLLRGTDAPGPSKDATRKTLQRLGHEFADASRRWRGELCVDALTLAADEYRRAEVEGL